MRYIVTLLLIANLGFLGWQFYQPAQPLPAVIAAPRPLLNQGLTLLQEVLQEVESEVQLDAKPSRLCYLVGDFSGIDDANSFLQMVEGRGFLAELYLSGESLPPNYRVYVPPGSSQAMATETMNVLSERLSAQNLQVEIYLITRGLLENAVALGVFGEIESAQHIQNQVSDLGYAVEIEEIPRSTGTIQLVLAKQDFALLDIAEWLEFAGDRPDLTYSENLCETIAQGVQFP